MAEVTYEAQQYFPLKCIECPWLVGLIEDGYISPNEISQAEVMDALREYCNDQNFETCEGPIIGKSSEDNQSNEETITCALLLGGIKE